MQPMRGMIDMKITLIEYVLSPILIAISSYIVWLLKQGKKERKAVDHGIMLLLRRAIIADHKKYCIDGEPMLHFNYFDINEMHEVYKALGGNGLTDKMFDELKEVVITED